MFYLIWAMFGVICLYQWVDGYQTWLLLHLGATESNPIVGFFIEEFGIAWGLFVPKLLAVIYHGICLRCYQNSNTMEV